jgi:CheY-like chemotaxis protein
MLSADDGTDEENEAVAAIHRHGRHLLNLVNDVLDYSKIEAGKLAFERRRVRTSELIGDVLLMFRAQASARGLSLSFEEKTSIPETIVTDDTRLTQVLINLVGNAVKFTERGGIRVVVSHDDRRRPPQWCFEIVDTGIGMDAVQLGRLFRPFVQADAAKRREFGGSGLGLAISKRIIEGLGGEITVESRPGAGSTFRFSVPALTAGETDGAVAPMGRPAASPPGDGGRSWALKGRRILLAEDGPDNLRLIARILRGHGAEVCTAENGQRAMELVEEAAARGADFDFILMDMQMTVMDGYVATARLRERGVRTPIAALTAHAMVGDRENCLSCGCDEYIRKPIDRASLIAMILKHLRGGESAGKPLAEAGAARSAGRSPSGPDRR